MVLAHIVKVLRSWLPYTFGGQHDPHNPELSALLKEPWLERMAANENIKPVLGAARMLSEDCQLPDDHLFKALLKTGLVEDMLFLFDVELLEAHLVIKLGRDVCGHKQIVHGGLTSSICDETYGALVYAMKQAQLLGAEPAVTANLSINYRKPIPRHVCLLCTVKMTKRDGRKLYMEAKVKDGPTGKLLADSTSLFVMIKPQPNATQNGSANGVIAKPEIVPEPLGSMKLRSEDLRKLPPTPAYEALCASIGL